jgi:hypothetical protein
MNPVAPPDVTAAADRVLRAMRALDAHRHDAAPTLEREYRRALEEYFLATQRELRATTDDDDALEADDDDAQAARVSDLRSARSAIAAHYAAARQALRLARAYRRDPASSGRRERECLDAVRRHRDAIHAARMHLRAPAEQLVLPGLAKTRPSVAIPLRATKTG